MFKIAKSLPLNIIANFSTHLSFNEVFLDIALFNKFISKHTHVSGQVTNSFKVDFQIFIHVKLICLSEKFLFYLCQ